MSLPVDFPLTFDNLSVEILPGEAHIIIKIGDGDVKPTDVIKESIAVGRLMLIAKRDSDALKHRLLWLENQLAFLAPQPQVFSTSLPVEAPREIEVSPNG